MLKRGDIVRILPNFRDDGDDKFTWVVISDEEKGRVDISPCDISLNMQPVYTIRVDQIEFVETMDQKSKKIS